MRKTMNVPRFHIVAGHVARAMLVMLCLLVSGCHIGPAYRLPAVPTAPSYKEEGPSLWKTAKPKDGVIRGRWWEMFQDPQLNALEERVDAGNQNIAAAIAHYDAARAVVRQTRSQYFPT